MSENSEGEYKYKTRSTKTFKKHLKLVERRQKGDSLKVLEVVELLAKGEELPEKYEDHELIGNRAGERECHIKPNLLLVYRIYDGVLILELVDTGTHKDVFPEKY